MMEESSTKWIILLFEVFALFGCDSCLRSLYGVHEEPTHIHEFFAADKNVVENFRHYVDSANAVYKANPSCTIPSLILNNNEKTFCLNNPDCECYLLTFPTGGGIVIEGFSTNHVSKNAWLLVENQINKEELNILVRHFREQVLNKFL